MTANAISYWKLREEQLHNRVSESISRASQAETVRSNMVRESQNAASLAEIKRHNIAEEQLGVISNQASLLHAQAAKASAGAAYAQAQVARMRQETDRYISLQNLDLSRQLQEAKIGEISAHTSVLHTEAELNRTKQGLSTVQGIMDVGKGIVSMFKMFA